MEGGEVIVRNEAATKTPIPISDSIFIVLLNLPEGFILWWETCFYDHQTIPCCMHLSFLLAACCPPLLRISNRHEAPCSLI